MGWKEFEQECYDYLCNTYGSGWARFIKLGEEDSTRPDILVSIPNEMDFYIETKEPLAQCGQFVLSPNDATAEFEYSDKNQSTINQFSRRMISYMNDNYSEFRNAGTKGKELNLDEMLFVNWIKKYYGDKGVKYFISKNEMEYVIFPIEKFEHYFDVTAVYRMKKSGSTNPSKGNTMEVANILDAMNIIYNIGFVGKKMHVYTNFDLDKVKKREGRYDFYFRKYQNDDYIVTKLSNTKNSNVIFKIQLKKKQDLNDLLEFEKIVKVK